MTTFATSVSQPVRRWSTTSNAVRVARRRPGVAGDDQRVADQHEQRHREHRQQGRELQPQPARRHPAPEEPRARGSSRAPAASGVDSIRCARPRCGSRARAGSGEITTAPTTTATTIPNTSAPFPAICVARSRLCASEVAEQRERRRPEPGAEDAVRDEGAVAHPRAAGDERGQRSHQTDEAPDQDRLAAVAREVVLDLLEALVGDPHLRARGGG